MARKFEFSIVAKFKDLASRKVKQLQRVLKGGFGRGLLGGLTGGVTGILGGLAGVATKVAGGIVSAFTRALKGVVGLFRKAVGTITGLLTKIGKVAGVAAAGAAAAFAVLWRQTARAGDALAKMSKRTGLAVEFLSELDHVAQLNDTSLEAVQMGLRGLGRAVEGAARGSKEYMDVFRALGVPLRDRNGQLRETEDLFWAMLDALGKVENRTLRLGMAQRVFGRSGEAMLVLVEAGTEALREQQREARRLGATWSGKYAADAERAMDSITRMGTAWRGLRRAFLAPFLEPVAKLLEGFAKRLAANRDQVRRWGETAAAAFTKAANAIGQRLKTAYDWLVTRDWSLEGLKEGFSNALVALDAFVRAAAGPAKETLVAAFEWVAAQIEGIFRTLWDVVLRDLRRKIGRELGKVGGAITGRASSMVKDALEEQAKKNYAKHRRTNPFMPRWEDASEADKAAARRGARLPIGVKMLTDAMAGAGKAMGDIGLELHDKPLTEAQKAQRAANIRWESDEKAAGAAERLRTGLDALGQAAQAARQGLGGAFPAAGAGPGTGAAGAAEGGGPLPAAGAAAGAAGQDAAALDILNYEDVTWGGKETEGRLRGLLKQAQKLSEQAKRLGGVLPKVLEKTTAEQEKTAAQMAAMVKRMQSIERRLSRLASARTGR
ncbi:MAG: hypothetical protein R6X33_00170 [Candidatus Brocadiia bacterium]